MNDDELTNSFFLESDSEQLRKIHQWARARYAAPWAVFFAVLLRVAASVGPNVQLPGVIGGRASLNLLCAFVSPSGGGKGISGKVARLAWPTPILELPIGSGEGIAEVFKKPAKPDADDEPVTAAIFDVAEIDTMAGLASRQGNILLAQLKSMAMGEQLGQTNASKATSRRVDAHTYRCCLSVGAQPGHAGVIFNDTTGGTPQRFLWALTIDPAMPATVVPDPDPLDTHIPTWSPNADGVVEIQYGPPEIAETIIDAHLARQRGEADALDGHAMLTRCKVAAVLASMHHRSVISEWDWQRSGEVMAVSSQAREWLLGEARRADREKIRNRAMARAAGEEFIDERRAEVVRRRILRILDEGPATHGAVHSRIGKREYKELFPGVVAGLLLSGEIVSEDSARGKRYSLGDGVKVDPGVKVDIRRSDGLTRRVKVDPEATVTDLDSRRSHESTPPKLTGRAWLSNHITTLRNAGYTTAESFAVLDAGEAAGHARQTIRVAASDHPDITVIGRNGKIAVWDITGTRRTKHQSAPDWTASYLDTLTRDGVDVVNKDEFKKAALAAGYSWTSARHAATDSDRIESLPGAGSETIWKIVTPTQETAS